MRTIKLSATNLKELLLQAGTTDPKRFARQPIRKQGVWQCEVLEKVCEKR